MKPKEKKDIGLRTLCQRYVVGNQITVQACGTFKSYPPQIRCALKAKGEEDGTSPAALGKKWMSFFSKMAFIMMLHQEQLFKKADQSWATFKNILINLWLKLLASCDPQARSLVLLALEN